MVRAIGNFVGRLAKLTYAHHAIQIPDWKYGYYFFFQRILMFNVHVPWRHHRKALVNVVKQARFRLGSLLDIPFKVVSVSSSLKTSEQAICPC